MRRGRFGVMVLALMALLSPAVSRAVSPERSAGGGGFQVDLLAEGVYLLRVPVHRSDRTNSVLVDLGEEALVVGAQPDPRVAQKLLRAISRLTDSPVRYLVLPAPHAAVGGGAAAFPAGVSVIASEGCRDALADAEYDFKAEMSRDKDVAREALERPLPELVPAARLVIAGKDREVWVVPLPHAHTRGDLLVYLPDQGIIVAGGLLPPNHDAFAEDADVGGWISVLNGILRRKPATIIPLRGGALGLDQVVEFRDLLAWLRGQVAETFINQVPLGKMADRVEGTEEFAERFGPAAHSPFVHDLVQRVVDEALAERRKRGQDY